MLELVSCSLLLGASMLGRAAVDHELVIRVPEGTALTKHAITVVELELSRASTTLNGEERPRSEGGYAELGARHRLEREVVLTDHYERVEHGYPYRFLRELDRIRTRGSSRVAAGRSATSWEHSSRLEGEQIRFEADGRGNDYQLELAHDTADKRVLLETVAADADMLALLPPGAVRAGSTWRVEPDALIGSVLFGGELDFPPTAERSLDELFRYFPFLPLPSLPQDPREWLRDVEGRVEAELVRMEGETPGDLAVIRYEFELAAARDAARDHGGRRELGVLLQRAEFEWKLVGTAELRWNVRAGRIEAFELKADIEARVDSEVTDLWDLAPSSALVQRSTRNRLRSEEEWRGTVETRIGLGDPFGDE